MSLNALSDRSAAAYQTIQSQAAEKMTTNLSPLQNRPAIAAGGATSWLSDLTAYIPGETLLLYSLTGAIVSQPKANAVTIFGFFETGRMDHWLMLFTIITPLLVYFLVVMKKREVDKTTPGAPPRNVWIPGRRTIWYVSSSALAFYVWGRSTGVGVAHLLPLDVFYLALTAIGLAFLGGIIVPRTADLPPAEPSESEKNASGAETGTAGAGATGS